MSLFVVFFSDELKLDIKGYDLVVGGTDDLVFGVWAWFGVGDLVLLVVLLVGI